MHSAVILSGTFLACVVCTALVRRYALNHQVVDQPSARGLHREAVPRGGGAAIVLTVSIAILVLWLQSSKASGVLLLWLVCGGAFGVLGWVDDHADLSIRVRLFAQFFLAVSFCCFSYWLNADTASVPWWYLIPLVLAMVWTVNLYNFMDGVDGFATTESCLVAGIGFAILSGINAAETTPIALLLAGASAGFILWNWEPARIFMGDVGSYFLGFQFAALIVYGVIDGSHPWVWIILLAPFVTDASLTLGRRFLAGEAWWRPHRSHVYQQLILNGWSHSNVCIALILATLGLFAPAAVAAAHYPHFGLIITVTAYTLAAIIWLTVRLRMNRID